VNNHWRDSHKKNGKRCSSETLKRLYISKGTAKASAVNLSRPNTLEGSKTAF